MEHLDGDEEDLEEFEVEKFVIPLSDPDGMPDDSRPSLQAPVDSKGSRAERKASANSASLLSKPSSSNDLSAILIGDDDACLHDDPLIISTYTNSASRNLYSIKTNQLGISGLRNELFSLNTYLAEGLKRRDKNVYSRDFRKSWERTVHDASCVDDFRKSLMDLEEVVHSVQSEPDRDDDEEIASSKKANYSRLIKEGWVFEMEISPYIGKFGRRFFYHHGLSNGVITAFLPADRNEGMDIWQMEHSDGDVEDLDESDIQRAIAYYDSNALEPRDEGDIVGKPEEGEGGEDGVDAGANKQTSKHTLF